jgi:hypothetical protein
MECVTFFIMMALFAMHGLLSDFVAIILVLTNINEPVLRVASDDICYLGKGCIFRRNLPTFEFIKTDYN